MGGPCRRILMNGHPFSGALFITLALHLAFAADGKRACVHLFDCDIWCISRNGFQCNAGREAKGPFVLRFALLKEGKRGATKGSAPIGNECFQLERKLENLLVSYFDFYCWNRNSNRACQFGLICQHLVPGIRISGGSVEWRTYNSSMGTLRLISIFNLSV